MHHHHDHGFGGHAHAGLDERRSRDRRALAGALALIVALMAIEVAAGIVASSLALLADAAHLLTDAFALALALVAGTLAARPARGRWTFGLGRTEVLAAQVNGFTLLIVGGVIAAAAVQRLIDPPEVRGGIVLVVAVVGMAVNALAAFLLMHSSRESINVRGAFLHITTDLAAFAGTAIAGALILLTGWHRLDPIASLIVAGLCFLSAYSLTRESMRIVLEGAPAGIDPEEVGMSLARERDVVEVHDLHIWTVTSGFPALSAHVLVRPGADCHALRRDLARGLAERFGIDHSTLQVEHAPERTGAVEIGEAVPRREPLDHR